MTIDSKYWDIQRSVKADSNGAESLVIRPRGREEGRKEGRKENEADGVPTLFRVSVCRIY